jgi:hypothetical protein
MIELVGIAVFAALFVVFALLNPMREGGGCRGCAASDGGAACRQRCPLLDDGREHISGPEAES